MNILSEIEARVLGSLVEKELTTPEYYPLSLNALVNACNQKSNRDPVMKLDENAVSQALRSLDKEGLAGRADAMDNRVTKFEHRLQEAFNFDRREAAILARHTDPKHSIAHRNVREHLHARLFPCRPRFSQMIDLDVVALQQRDGLLNGRFRDRLALNRFKRDAAQARLVPGPHHDGADGQTHDPEHQNTTTRI